MDEVKTKKKLQLIITLSLIGILVIPIARAAKAPTPNHDHFKPQNSRFPTQRYDQSNKKAKPLIRNRVQSSRKMQSRRPAQKTIQRTSGIRYKRTQVKPIFDFPVTYNARVRYWIKFFQTDGRKWFKRWLERSTKYIPLIQTLLRDEGMPLDIAYVAMIESGFSNRAKSHASAVGMWQFIKGTGNRYGLRTSWWIDERKDFLKATRAAIRYKKDLYKMFGSWHLVAASYNTGENRIKRLIKRHNTNSFWKLADKGVIPDETINYVPKIIAATLIAKAPGLYGFRNLRYQLPLQYEYMHIPGGTNLKELAMFMGVKSKYLKELNPELIKGYIPKGIPQHRIRVPQGSSPVVSRFIKKKINRQRL